MPVVLIWAGTRLLVEHILGEVLDRLLVRGDLLLEGDGVLLVLHDFALLDLDLSSRRLGGGSPRVGLLSAHFARGLAQMCWDAGVALDLLSDRAVAGLALGGHRLVVLFDGDAGLVGQLLEVARRGGRVPPRQVRGSG